MSLPEQFLNQLEQYQTLSQREQEVFMCLFGKSLSRQQIALELNISKSNVSTSLSGIYRKFSIASDIGRGKENHLRDYLMRRYSGWADRDPKAKSEPSDIAALVQELRQKIQPYVQQRCGTMRVLNMNQPIELGDIYTEVNILEKLTAHRRLEIQELFENCRVEDAKEFDRFGLAKVTEKRVPGQKAVKRHSKLMVLGRPGAGKTTFLKYLAMQCMADELFPDYLPLFVTLKEFAESEAKPNLEEYCNRLVGSPLQSIYETGKALILLDGLDEVQEKDSRHVNQQIQALAERFPQTHIVLTCRIAAKSYTFQQFVEVEVADFNPQQIQIFVKKWFQAEKPEKAAKFLERLEENQPIKELANNPLLLTLLCLIFEEKNKFKENRSELYGEGIELLLEKWDNSRDIERDQLYKNLSTQRKEDLLSKLALITFATDNYFFRRREAEYHIGEYIRNLPQADATALEVDSKKVLRSITAQHGLLIERAVDIYSFSHLTFHEYFTAREITLNAQFDLLAQHITEKSWREVFLLTTSMLRNADELMRLIKARIDELLERDEKLQQFLIWMHEKARSVEFSYKPAAVRAFYLYLDRALYLDRDLTRVLDLARVLDHALDHALDRALDLTHEHALALTRVLDRARTLDRNLALDRNLDRALDLARDLAKALDRNLPLDLARARNRALARDLYSELQLTLQELKDELPAASQENRDQFRTWWNTNGQVWTEKLRARMIEHRKTDHNWQFSQKQKRLLQQYCDANLLLVNCLNSDCYVSREVREEIEETLLLPIEEIKRRKGKEDEE